MADQGWAYRAVPVFMVATIFALAVWVNAPHAHASEASGTPCPSSDFTIDDAQQTVPFYYDFAGYKEGAGSMHVTVPSAGYIEIADASAGRVLWGGLADSAGTFGFDVFAYLTDSELVKLSKNQESVTVEYEVTFRPYDEFGYPSGDPCLKTTSIKFVPAEAPYTFFGCGFTVQVTCNETSISLSIKNHVWSGEVTEPAGGTRCRNTVIGFEKRRSDGTWKRVSGFGEVKTKNGVYSVTIDRSNKRVDKKTARLFSKGTFRTWLARGWLADDATPYDEWCGASGSAPVKI